MRPFVFYEADVTVLPAAAVPKDEAALCHVSAVNCCDACDHSWRLGDGAGADICNRNIARQHER